MNRLVALLSATAAIALAVSPLAAQTDTTFTYQGSLHEQGAPADGSFNLEFSLFDALSDGTQVGSTIVLNGVSVSDGLFAAELDFGTSAFDNSARWLEIVVDSTTLSPRQPITRSPYSIQTRGIFVDANNKIGIGTTTPSARLDIRATEPDALIAATTSSTGRAVFGYANSLTGNTHGVAGYSDSTTGRGVFGDATSNTGVNYGVRGNTNSPDGYAGYFTGARNYFQGRVGIGTDSPNFSLDIDSTDEVAFRAETSRTSNFAKAVYGIAGSGGTTTGVYGSSTSTIGRGVYGFGSSTTGGNQGVYGLSSSSSGTGVLGKATASSGITEGVLGGSDSNEGRGVAGWAYSLSGFTYGVYGGSYSPDGTGVYGTAFASSGTTYGVRGQSNSTSGRGVYGEASASSGATFGVLGVSNSTSGRGVRGTTSATTGFTYALEGRAASTNGRGVWGYATASSGFNIGVLGKSNSAGGWDFYADGIGGNYGTGSSIRWKSNVTNIDNPLDKLAQLRGVYFDWDSDHGGQHDVGMIAEEVGKVLPEIVNYEENGVDAIGMDYSKMTPLLVEAVNALRSEKNAQITALRNEKDTEIAELTQRLAELEQLVQRLALSQPEEDTK